MTLPRLDPDAVQYAADIIATNYIWKQDHGLQRESVAQTIAGTAVHAYLCALEGRMLVPRSFVESVLYSGSFEGEDLDRLHRQAEELLG